MLPKPKAFDKIAAGLEDAIAFMEGDTRRGTVHRVRVKPHDNVITTLKVRPKPKPAVDTSVVDQHAKAYNIELSTGEARTVRGYTVTGLGEILGTSGVNVTRWEKRGMIPKPIFNTARGAIYHVEEARSFFRILSGHQENHRQYRAEHADLRQKLFSENAQIRRGLFPTK